MSRKVLILGVLGVLALAGLACRRGGEAPAPTLPTPETRTVTFRVVSAQTLAPVAGARVTARKAEGGLVCVRLGDVLAEAVSGPDGWVTLRDLPGTNEPGPVRRDVVLRIEAGPRFLVREVFLGDTPGGDPDVYPLWELNPEIGATERMTWEINDGGVVKPLGPVYVEVPPELESYRSVLERAARRDNEVLDDPAVPIRVVSQGQAPAGAFRVALELAYIPACYFNQTSCSSSGCVIRFCEGIEIQVAMHELGHVMGLDHHSGEGVMAWGYGTPRLDWTEQEVWAVRPRRYRQSGNVWPDRGIRLCSE